MLLFESDPDAEFEFFLAEKLGKTIDVIENMPHEEFVRWRVYYGRKAQLREIELARAKARR